MSGRNILVMIANDSTDDLNFIDDLKEIVSNFREYGILNNDIYCFLLKSLRPSYSDYDSKQFEGKLIRCFTEDEFKRKISRLIYTANLEHSEIIYYTIGKDSLNKFDMKNVVKGIPKRRGFSDSIFVEYKTDSAENIKEMKKNIKTKGFRSLMNLGKKYGSLNRSVNKFLLGEKNNARAFSGKFDISVIQGFSET